MKKLKKYMNFFVLLWCIPTSISWANSLNNEVQTMASSAKEVRAGKQLFDTVCASCHGKTLAGATGFNLKDGEWIHGSQPADIIHNIKNGFAKAGMPSFSAMYNEQQLKQITAYIVSKREGWDNLTYKIYELDANVKKLSTDVLKKLTPVKSGKVANNMPDFALPEIRDYALVFEGDFYQPYKRPVKIETSYPPGFLVEAELDGEKVESIKKGLKLKQGKQKLKITLMTTHQKMRKKDRGKGKTNLSLLVTAKGKRKLFAASARALKSMHANQLDVKVKNTPIVQRKRVLDLAPFSIAVGLTDKMNYAFNAKNCSISGAWSGDLLNIGPNVKNRGSDNSLILGNWIFHAPDGIKPIGEKCRFNKYNRQGNPSFYFTLDGVEYKLNGQASANKSLALNYAVVNNSAKLDQITFTLPPATNITSLQGKVSNNKVTIDLSQHKTFTLNVSAAGAE